MASHIKCLHCAQVFEDAKGYVAHCRESHAEVVRAVSPKPAAQPAPAPPRKPKKPRPPTAASKPKKPKKPTRTVEMAASYKPVRDDKRVRMRYDHWINVRNTRDGKPWLCKSCETAFATYEDALAHLRSAHKQQVLEYSKRKAEQGRPKRGTSAGSQAKGVFSGYGMSAGWAMPVGGGLPGLGKNR